MRTRASQWALLLVGLAPVAVTACDLMKKKDATADAAPAASPGAATTAPTDPVPVTALPSTTTPAVPGRGGGVRPRLPDGGLGPLTFPDGGIPALPSGFPTVLPSGFPTVLPSNLPPIPSGFPTVLPSNLPPWPGQPGRDAGH